jgi:fructoselysine-6-P-deglycase FrlB-like protein
MNNFRMKNKWLLMVAPLVVSTLLTNELTAQYRQNYGLLKPLPDSLLPHSKGAIDQPIPVPKVKVNSDPVLLDNGSYLLNQGWELANDEMVTLGKGSPLETNYNTSHWYNAKSGHLSGSLYRVEQYAYPRLALSSDVVVSFAIHQPYYHCG